MAVTYPAPIEQVWPPIAVIDGDTTTMTTATFKTLVNGSGSTVYTFTASFTFVRGGQHLHFRGGASYALDPTLVTALQAASAPMAAA